MTSLLMRILRTLRHYRPILVLLAFLTGTMLGATGASAQDEPVRADSSAEYTFGQALRFELQVKTEAPITGVSLFFNTPDMEGTYVVDFDVPGDRQFQVQHEVSLTQVQLAPFTTVTYWWRISTEDGPLAVEEKSLLYVDDRFDWQSLQQDETIAYWTDGDTQIGQTVLDVLGAALPRMEAIIPPVDIEPLRIFVYPSTADLRTALRLTGRDWVGAEAQPELGVILVTAVNPRTLAYDLGQSIPHEMTHLMLYEATGVGYENIPAWFEEGLANFFEGASDATENTVLRDAVASGETFPLSQLCAAFPVEERAQRLAYAQSASVISYIQDEYGNAALSEMIGAYADGAGCETGVQRSLGITLSQLEAEWLEQEQPLSPTARLWREYGLWLILLGGGLVLTVFILMPIRTSNGRKRKDIS